jgi:predicted acylesterase/phospholipase RssA
MKSIDLNELKHKKIALVLSGGVVKAAAWHLGVAHALEELGFYLKSNKNAGPGQTLNQRSLEIGTYVGSSAGAMICIYLASGYTPQDIIQSTLSIKGAKIRGINYKDMFTIRRPDLKTPKSGLYSPLEGFPSFLKNMIKPVVGLPGFFSTEGVRSFHCCYSVRSLKKGYFFTL